MVCESVGDGDDVLDDDEESWFGSPVGVGVSEEKSSDSRPRFIMWIWINELLSRVLISPR